MRKFLRDLNNVVSSAVLATALFSFTAFGQSGPLYEIAPSVISTGGGLSEGIQFAVIGTIGQAAAGALSTSGSYAVHGGFWQSPLAPTAAAVSISGKVISSNGAGLSNVRITLIDHFGNARSTRTNSFGNYCFNGVGAGETYIISAYSTRYLFVDQTQVIYLNNDVTGLDFATLPD